MQARNELGQRGRRRCVQRLARLGAVDLEEGRGGAPQQRAQRGSVAVDGEACAGGEARVQVALLDPKALEAGRQDFRAVDVPKPLQ